METQNKYLLLARRAREEDNAEDARKYYDMVRTEDPENAEAKFFYSYYRMFSDTKGHAYSNYVNFCKGIKPTTSMILGSEDTADEKKKFLLTIVDCLEDAFDAAVSANRDIGAQNGLEILSAYKTTKSELISTMMKNFGDDVDVLLAHYNFKVYEAEHGSYGHEHMIKYNLGDEIESKYANEPRLMEFAVKVWKDNIAKQQHAWGTSSAKECPGYPEKYAEKVKKYEPSYQMPSRTQSQICCIKFGKK